MEYSKVNKCGIKWRGKKGGKRWGGGGGGVMRYSKKERGGGGYGIRFCRPKHSWENIKTADLVIIILPAAWTLHQGFF